MENPIKKLSDFLLPPWRLGSKVMKASDRELEFWSGYAVVTGWAFAGLLVFGLLLELDIALENPAYGSPVERWGTVFCDFLVAVGVGGEVLMAALADFCQEELTRRAKLELAEAKEDLEQLGFESGAMEVNLEKAINDLAETQRKLGEAIERAAKANERAAEAELQTARLRSEFGWRTLSAEQFAQFSTALRASGPGKINIWYVVGDAELYGLALIFAGAVQSAGWEFSLIAGMPQHIQFGLRVRPPYPDEDRMSLALKAALNAAAVPFSDELFPQFGMTSGSAFAYPAPDLFVGPKIPGTDW